MSLTLIDPFYFIIALCIGILIAYITQPKSETIIKYPTPFNAGKLIYKDDQGVCYKYMAKPATCPLDKSLIKTYLF